LSYLRDGKFEIIAHRGGSHEAPENTLLAFGQILRKFPEAIIELDIHQTADGKIVVFHDDALNRVTNGRGMIWETSFKDLDALDAAYNFSQDGGRTFPHRGQGVKIPLLSEVFEKFPSARISIEFKHPVRFYGGKVLEIVRRYRAQDRVVLAGGDHDNLVKVAGLAPEMCSGFSARELFQTLIWGTLRLNTFCPARGHVLQIPFRHKNIPVATKNFIKNAHRRGLHVHVWTINDEATMRHLIELGVDGIVTDAPSLLLSVARTLKKI
jgi:glycerophosphoryl diester phosphodiesterase